MKALLAALLALSSGCGATADPASFDEPAVTLRSCRGAPQVCGSFREVGSCEAQRGCFFHDSGLGAHHDRCDGEVVRCETLASERRCVEQVGCSWR